MPAPTPVLSPPPELRLAVSQTHTHAASSDDDAAGDHQDINPPAHPKRTSTQSREVRHVEDARGQPYDWLVRTRPDTFFRAPVRPPPREALGQPSGFYCRANDAFYVASASAAPALFGVWSLANEAGCRWVGNTSMTRRMPRRVQCGLSGLAPQHKFIWPDCILRLVVYRFRLQELGCEETLNTKGRDFFRAQHCAEKPCKSARWDTRNPFVYFPISPHELPSDHGNLSLDRDILEWGVATGAIIGTKKRR